MPRTVLRLEPSSHLLPEGGAPYLADVDGDGHADLCIHSPLGLDCAHGVTGSRERWARPTSGKDPFAGALRFADVDGDKRADVCVLAEEGIVCARSTGTAFEAAHTWMPKASIAPAFDAFEVFELGDVDGDGRADLCSRSVDDGRVVIACALSTGHAFGRLDRWSLDFDAADATTLRLADINGDGRADLCGIAHDGGSVVCALSTGRAFTRATTWGVDAGLSDSAAARSFVLADVNGDGRADACFRTGEVVRCGLAP
jgi:FG-GAP-like repeat